MSEKNEENLDAEIQDVDTSVDNDTNDTLNQEEANPDEKYLNAKRRAEKAEAEKKELQAKLRDLEGKDEKPVETGLSRTETILLTQGYSPKDAKEAIEKLQKIAVLEGITDEEAMEDDIFKNWRESQVRKAKASKAQLGTANGSGKVTEKKSFDTAGISSEDHKALFREKMGR